MLPEVILCGFERGGTTVLSEWLRKAGYFSYFEMGPLLFSDLKNFKKNNPYIKILETELKNIARLTNEKEIRKIDFSNYETVYNSLFQNIDSSKFFDKTPRYMSVLGDVVDRSPFCKKYIVITRDPRNLFYSWAKRIKSRKKISTIIKENLSKWAERYKEYYFGCIAYIEDPDVLFIKHEDLCLNPLETKKNIEIFLEKEIKTSKIFNDKSSYANAEKGVVFDKAFDGISNLSVKLNNEILENTKFAAPFFHNDENKKAHLVDWYEKFNSSKELIEHFKLKNHSEEIAGKRIDPLFYYLLHNDVRKAKVNAVKHYESVFKKEKNRLSYKISEGM